MLPGQIAGILVGIVVLGGLTVWLILENRKIKEEIQAAKDTLQKEGKEKLTNADYEKFDDDRFVIATSYIYGIVQKGENMVVKCLFYNRYWEQYVPFKAKMTKNEYESKNLKVGDFVKTVHKIDETNMLNPRKGKEFLL